MTHMTRMKRKILVVASILVQAAPTASLAKKKATESEQIHRKALESAKNGFYVKARELWEKAYALDKNPKYLFNLGQICEEMDKPVEALDYFERFIATVSMDKKMLKLIDSARRKTKALAQRVSVLEIHALQAGVRVYVDQRLLGKGPLSTTVRLPQGKHIVVATLEGHHGETLTLSLYGGQRRKISIELKKILPKVIKYKASVRYPMPRWLPWTILGLGIATAASSIALFVSADDKYKTYDSNPAAYPDLKKKADHHRTGAIVLVVAGGIIAAGGLAAVFLNRPKLKHRREARRSWYFDAVVTPWGAQARLRF